MPTGACRIADTDVLGDVVTGPCCTTVLIDTLTASVLGDIVSGTAMVGEVIEGSPSVLFGGIPANRIGSAVEGENEESGAPVASVMLTGSLTVLVD
ncbi:MAG: PAAR domain-containing protein [Gemmataceae bacterium]